MKPRALLAPLAAVVAAVLVLTACAGLPTSGDVNAVPAATADAQAPDFAFIPNGPQKGSTPAQIVEDFIRAASGPGDDWATAKLFLTPSFRERWQPNAGVTIDALAERQPAEEGEGTVTWRVTPRASVDADGSYAPTDGGTTTLPFSLEQQADGEWRISQAPDGILLDEDLFRTVFHAYSLMFFDPQWEYLVPDIRWFPTVNAATRIAGELVGGTPSPWLAGSVVTAFPETVALGAPSVPVTDGGIARVELVDGALLVDPTTLGRMKAQLDASLATVTGVTGVALTAGGASLSVSAADTLPTRVDSRALVISAAGLGFVAGTELDPLTTLAAAAGSVDPVSLEVSADRTVGAALLRDGTVARLQADGQALAVDERTGLLDPTLDPAGYVWSVPEEHPTELIAVGPLGERAAIQSAWLGATRIDAMQMSRDGTRLAAVVSIGGRTVVEVAGVVRDVSGAPVSLGTPVTLAAVDGLGIDVGWLDDATIGVLAGPAEAPVLLSQQVGGLSSTIAAPARAVSLAGVNLPTAVRLRDADGVLYTRRSSTWQQTGTGVDVLVTQQGEPEH